VRGIRPIGQSESLRPLGSTCKVLVSERKERSKNRIVRQKITPKKAPVAMELEKTSRHIAKNTPLKRKVGEKKKKDLYRRPWYEEKAHGVRKGKERERKRK